MEPVEEHPQLEVARPTVEYVQPSLLFSCSIVIGSAISLSHNFPITEINFRCPLEEPAKWGKLTSLSPDGHYVIASTSQYADFGKDGVIACKVY
jgi:hypothetical protein